MLELDAGFNFVYDKVTKGKKKNQHNESQVENKN